MPKEKLIIEKKSNKEVNYSKPVFLDSDTHKKLKELSNETGISIKALSTRFIEYAMDNVTIKEVGE